MLLVTRRLLNGRYHKRGVIEHFCVDPTCCRNMEHTIVQFESWIGGYVLPALFCRRRWLGVEQPCDSIGFLTMAHNQFEEIWRMTFVDKTKAATVTVPGDFPAPTETPHESDPEDENAERMSDQELQLEEPTKEADHEIRHSTFRANGTKWISTGIAGSLWVFRSNIRLQQESRKLSCSPQRSEMLWSHDAAPDPRDD